MRRMRDDEGAVLRCLAADDNESFTLANITLGRLITIDNTFRYHGIVDEFGRITKRGRHVADLLPPVVVMELPTIDIAEPIETDQTETEDWD